MDDQTPHNDESTTDNTLRRRMLLKAAVGAGVAVAAHSAPRVGSVPAYGLTTTGGGTDGKCYAIGWSSNNPDGKGWMELGKDTTFADPVLGPDRGPSSDAGDGTAVYEWDIPALGPSPAFIFTLTAKGCVNTGNGQLTPSGMPTGLCMRFYNNGRSTDEDFSKINQCGGNSDLLAAGNYQVDTTVLGNGQTTGITVPPGCTDCDGDCNDIGKMAWVWDIAPC